jgi:phosphate transport system protein
MREKFEQDLKRLQAEVVQLGMLAEQAVRGSVESLRQQDLARARTLIEEDRVINEKRFALENEVLTLIATQQPMAGDLRMLASALELAAEMERIADYAKGIAIITLAIGNEPLVKPLVDIFRMTDKACGMLHRALDAFIRSDVELARVVPKEDQVVDELYQTIYRDLIACVMANPSCIDQAQRLTWVAHNLERVADRVSNICERVVFAVTGRIEELTI